MRFFFTLTLGLFSLFGSLIAKNKIAKDSCKNYLEFYYSTNNSIKIDKFSRLKSEIASNLVTNSFGVQYHKQLKQSIALGCNFGLFERGITITNQKHTYYTNKGQTENISYESGTQKDGYLLFSGYFSFTSLNLKKLKISTDLQLGLLTNVYTNTSSEFIGYNWSEKTTSTVFFKLRLEYLIYKNISFSIVPNCATSIFSHKSSFYNNPTIVHKLRPFSYGVGIGLGYKF